MVSGGPDGLVVSEGVMVSSGGGVIVSGINILTLSNFGMQPLAMGM